MRNTSACRCLTAFMIGSPLGPICCSAKPTSSAMNSTCSTLSPVKAEKNVVGMMPRMNSCVVLASVAVASYVEFGHVEALAGVDEVADDEPDRQRERRHDHEVQQRQAADLADGRGLGDRADADHDRAEDDRRDHHLDEGDEPLADRLERDAEARAR